MEACPAQAELQRAPRTPRQLLRRVQEGDPPLDIAEAVAALQPLIRGEKRGKVPPPLPEFRMRYPFRAHTVRQEK